METAIMLYSPFAEESIINQFAEAVLNNQLPYYAGMLEDAGFSLQQDVHQAMERTMKIFSVNGIPIEAHMKAIYVYSPARQSVVKDWKLSKMAYLLLLLNGNPDHPLVSRMQMELVSHYF